MTRKQIAPSLLAAAALAVPAIAPAHEQETALLGAQTDASALAAGSTPSRGPPRTACRSWTSAPRRADTVAVYDCNVTQGDVQIFRQADEPGRVFATSTSDTFGSVDDSGCYRDAAALGFDVRKQTASRAALPGAAGVTSPRRSVA